MSSRLPGFYKQTVSARVTALTDRSELTADEVEMLVRCDSLTPELADKLIENVVGVFGMPLGIAANFIVNGRDVLVPMVVEEPSIVAGASFMAKLIRRTGGFTASSTEPQMIGQINLLDVPDLDEARARILAEKPALLEAAGRRSQTMIARGGGPRDIEVRLLPETPAGPMLVCHLIFDCRDANGANMVNTACEALAEPLAAVAGGRVGLRILSNLADRRLARAACTVLADDLAFGEFSGDDVVAGIVEAWAFAAADPYRAATHNKGIMNGVDPLVIATGNDWRGVEAGAHAYAARDSRYTAMSVWSKAEDGSLHGELEIPMPLGIVGGTTRVHPVARIALKLLGVQSARELAEIAVSVGLAQNLAALRALATEGIQRGHMSLHARQIAVAAGAQNEQVDEVAAQMLAAGQITLTYAQEILQETGGIEDE
ncbi:MAG: hydroxymethylglutaryl-CoA reductase, degradative [Anaerolineae bacterium]